MSWNYTFTNQTTPYVDQTQWFVPSNDHQWFAPPNAYQTKWQYSQWDQSQPAPKEQPEMQLYEYAVIYIPRDNEGHAISDECYVLIPPDTYLADREEHVRTWAIRAVDDPEGELNWDFVVVVVRPFGGR